MSGRAAPEPEPAPRVGDFDRVERAADAGRFVRWLDDERRTTGGSRGLSALRVEPGERVLDVGSGTGEDLLALSTTPLRLAAGVDLSETMTREAAARSHERHVPVRVGVADAQALPFADATFDACWVRAVLVHTPDPERAVTEIARVLRPGGRVVLGEPDHDTHVVDTTELDVFDRVRVNRRKQFRHPRIGRHLAALLRAAGFDDIEVRARPIVYRDIDVALRRLPLDQAVDDAVADGAITEAEAVAFNRSLRLAAAENRFVLAATSFSVSAVKPSPPS